MQSWLLRVTEWSRASDGSGPHTCISSAIVGYCSFEERPISADETARSTSFRTLSVADAVPAGRPGNVRWSVCAMLFFATSINYMDRQVLGIPPLLQHNIGWTEAQYGYIVSGSRWLCNRPGVWPGRMVDRLGCRIGYAIVMGIWSVAAMSHALARTALQFGIARFFLGLGESGNFPAAIKTTAEWFPQRERSLATGIFNSGANVGAILAPAIVPWIALRFGWRPAFLLTGIFSAIWIAWWLTHYRKPAEHPRIRAAELQHIYSDPPQPIAQLPSEEAARLQADMGLLHCEISHRSYLVVLPLLAAQVL